MGWNGESLLGFEQGRRLLIMKRARGFSLVEVVVAMAIAAILLSLGLPAWQTYLNNSKLRATAQSFLTGIQAARTEAVRRNSNIDFVLTDAVNLDATSVAVAGGRGWVIRTSDGATFIEGKSFEEGAANNGVVVGSGATSTITFTGLGTTTLAADLTLNFSNPAGGNCVGGAPAGPMRCLDIAITRGGQSKLCDPTVAADDTRSC